MSYEVKNTLADNCSRLVLTPTIREKGKSGQIARRIYNVVKHVNPKIQISEKKH